MKINHNKFLKLAFNLAKINLGKTKSNPSVGCVVVKDNSVISSGYTSLNGRPHAEANALNKKKLFLKNSILYTTMEPCTHYGVTPPCTDLIKKKKIKNVFFSSSDVDKRTSNKAISRLKGIQVRKLEVKKFNNFYESYKINKEKLMPFINAKIALSKDLYSISKKKKWITNSASRSRVHLIRSEYDTIISTSKSINKDNSLLNCRLNGFDNTKPSLIIVDLNLKIKKNLKLFKLTKKRKITIISSIAKGEKISFLKKIGVKFITISSLKTKDDFSNLFKLLKKRGHNRILIETGLTFLFSMLKFNLINYFYIFVSKVKLGKQGRNNIPVNMLKSLKLHKEIKVNLYGDKLYKINIKNV